MNSDRVAGPHVTAVGPVVDRATGEQITVGEDGYDTYLVKAFAQAVIRPGGSALLLKHDNTADRWVPLEEAIDSGRAFTVDVQQQIFALDSDQPERIADVDALAAELTSAGLRPVVLASGRDGHRHLFCRFPYKEARLAYESRVGARGFRGNALRRSIRPPLSPHRLGLRGLLLRPSDTLAALLALVPPPLETLSSQPRGLSERMEALLRDGDRTRRYRSRSEVIQALALAAVNVGWTMDMFLAELLDRGHAAGEKIRAMLPHEARRHVELAWSKAGRRAQRRPPLLTSADAAVEIAQLAQVAERALWRGRAGASDLVVLQAHYIIAWRSRRLVHHADVRNVADLAGVALGTVVQAHRRLRDAGWLQLVGGAHGTQAAEYRLSLPVGRYMNTPTSQGPEHHVNTPTSPYGGRVESVHVADCGAAGDVWRWAALGKLAYRVWDALRGEVLATSSDVASKLRADVRSVRRRLKRLERHRLAVALHGQWQRGDADPREVAERLGVAGVGTRQHARHERQREVYRRVGMGCPARNATTAIDVAGRRARVSASQLATPERRARCEFREGT